MKTSINYTAIQALNLPEVRDGIRYSLSVRTKDSGWYGVTSTRTYEECVKAMEAIKPHLTEGTLIMAYRGIPSGPHTVQAQYFLFSQVGRQHHLRSFQSQDL